MNSTTINSDYIKSYFLKQLDKPVYNYAGYMSTKALDDFSLQLVNYRIKNKLNQQELANQLKISQPMISQYESGSNNISIKRLCEICEQIGIRVRIRFEETGEIEKKESINPYCLDTRINETEVA